MRGSHNGNKSNENNSRGYRKHFWYASVIRSRRRCLIRTAAGLTGWLCWFVWFLAYLQVKCFTTTFHLKMSIDLVWCVLDWARVKVVKKLAKTKISKDKRHKQSIRSERLFTTDSFRVVPSLHARDSVIVPIRLICTQISAVLLQIIAGMFPFAAI